MNPEQIVEFLKTPWAIFLVIAFFGGSIFLHELGHFLAARWRGMKVLAFAVGFGPKMFGWRGSDGVEYKVCWIPLGGYVQLPQLAEMAAIEGEYDEGAETLPPISYMDKMIVAVAGVTFNMIFAYVLAAVIWAVGMEVPEDSLTTRVGYVGETVTLSDGEEVPGPAHMAGLKVGDVIRKIDGDPVQEFTDVQSGILTGVLRTPGGEPLCVMEVERDGAMVTVEIVPAIATRERIRQVGIMNWVTFVVGEVGEDSPAAAAGLVRGMQVESLAGVTVHSWADFNAAVEALGEPPYASVEIVVVNGGEPHAVTLEPRPETLDDGTVIPDLGFAWERSTVMEHVPPHERVAGMFGMIFKTLVALVHPQSNVGISNLSGPVGILSISYRIAMADFMSLLWLFTFININLAVVNMLPFPILDGGHILIATMEKIAGRRAPKKFVEVAFGISFMLIIGFFLYVTFHDIRRQFPEQGAQVVQETGTVPEAGSTEADPGVNEAAE